MKEPAMTTQIQKLVRVPVQAGVCAGLMLLSVACGGGAGAEAGGPKTAAQAQADQNPGTAVAATPAGQQFAVSDAPTSGAPAAQRPAMNASALAAYQAGMQAFQAGDLQGAKTQFVAATQADAKAYQAYYSLGVVRERLNEGSRLRPSSPTTSQPSSLTVCCSRVPARRTKRTSS
jgi:TolA-binding protein